MLVVNALDRLSISSEDIGR